MKAKKYLVVAVFSCGVFASSVSAAELPPPEIPLNCGIQMKGDTFNITFFDDVLATGGTAIGIAQALNREVINVNGKDYKVKVKEFLFLVEFPDLYDHDVLNAIAPVHSFVQINGD